MGNKLVASDGKSIQATESIADLTNKMIQTFDELCLGVIDEKTSEARCKVALTICNTLKTEILYNKLKGNVLNIELLDNKKALAKDNATK